MKFIGGIKTDEIDSARLWWIKCVQEEAKNSPEFASMKIDLKLQPNSKGILKYRGRIKGEYPIYLATNLPFSEMIVEHVHITTIHGGVPATMAETREW